MSTQNVHGVAIGLEISRQFRFTDADVHEFARLVNDNARVHHDKAFATELGYSDVIVFGHLAVAPFSGLIGEELPGDGWVILRHSFEFRQPLYIGQEVVYTGRVVKVRPQLRIIEIDLSIQGVSGAIITGRCQCKHLSS